MKKNENLLHKNQAPGVMSQNGHQVLQLLQHTKGGFKSEDAVGFFLLQKQYSKLLS